MAFEGWVFFLGTGRSRWALASIERSAQPLAEMPWALINPGRNGAFSSTSARAGSAET